jgi:alkyl hydroperoxide reductase 1
MTDTDAGFSKSIGWESGGRTMRYAIIIDHGKVTYADVDTERGSIAKSGAEGVLAKL